MSKKAIIISISILLIAALAVGVSFAVWRIDVINAEIAAESGEWNESVKDMVFEPINDTETNDIIGYKVTAYNGRMTNLVIPSQYDDKPVISIGSNFKRMGALVTLVIPSSITTIEDNALMGCYALKKITFSEGLVNIGNFVLLGCNELTYVKLPSTLTAIGDAALSQCAKLAVIDIGATQESLTMGEHVFLGNNIVAGDCTVNYGTGV